MGFSLSGVVRRTRAFRPAVRAVRGGNLTQHTRWCHTAREPVKKWLHRGRAWFETRPAGAPHHEGSFFDGTEKLLILRRPRSGRLEDTLLPVKRHDGRPT